MVSPLERGEIKRRRNRKALFLSSLKYHQGKGGGRGFCFKNAVGGGGEKRAKERGVS
jgi:hypothetical protein